jgi:predicted N-acyltransferase
MLDPEFDAAIKNFLKHETEHMFEYIDEMHTRSPFKQS